MNYENKHRIESLAKAACPNNKKSLGHIPKQREQVIRPAQRFHSNCREEGLHLS